MSATPPDVDKNPPHAPPDALSEDEARRFRNVRRIGIAFIALLVLLAAVGALGQKTSRASASSDGYTLDVLYPSIVRPGLDARLEITVSNPNGFGKSLSISLNHHYFDIFDLNSLRPDADSNTSNGSMIVYTWDAPKGTSFRFSFDMTAEYGEHLGLDGFASVLARDAPAVTVHFHSRWMP